MRRLLLAAALLLASAGGARAAVGPDNSGWPMIGGNAQHTSTATSVGVQAPKISWVHHDASASNSRQYAGVVLGSNGTIYVGGRNIFEALNPNGSTKWTAAETAAGSDSFGTPAVGANSIVYISSAQVVYGYDVNTGVWSSSAALTLGGAADSGGAGAVTLGPTGRVYVAHGDDTAAADFNTGRVNEYVLDSTLTPYTTFFVGSTTNRASSVVLSTDGARAIVANFTNLYVFGDQAHSSGVASYGTALMFYPGFSVRPDGTMVLNVMNGGNFCANPVPTNYAPNGAFSLAYSAGWQLTNIWGQCSDINAAADTLSNALSYHSPVSSSPATSYLYIPNSHRVYSLGNAASAASPGINWSYDVTSLGFTPTTDSVGPLTLAGGNPATLYFTYCSASSNTRLVALNANTGARDYDVMISTSNCFSGQPVPTTGGRMYLYNGPDVIALEESGATGVAVTTSAASTVGDFWYSTVTVSATKAGGVAVSSGVPVEVSSFGTSSVVLSPSITPSATGFITTDATGKASFPVQWRLGTATSETWYPGLLSTITFRSPGLPDQTIYLKESRPTSIAISSATGSFTGSLRVSTVTFTLKDSLGAGVPNVPCKITTSGTGANSLSLSPDLTSVAFAPTNGSGQANVVVYDDLNSLPGSSYAAYVATFTAACLDQPAQTVYVKETRVASVAVSTGVPTIFSTLRYSTVTVTLKDGLGAGVPDVPVNLEFVGSPATVSITPIPDNALTFSTSDASGQAKFLITEDMSGMSNTDFAGWVSTFNVHVLSHASQPLYLKEERVATVSFSTGTPTVDVDGSGVPTLRVSTITLTLTDASGAPVPNVPVYLDPISFLWVNSPVELTGVDVPFTDGSGQARFRVEEDLDPAAIDAQSQFAGLVSSLTVNAAGFPDSLLPLKEERVASVTFSSSPAVMQGDYRVFYVTATVKDITGAGVPNVPVGLTSLNFRYFGTPFQSFVPATGDADVGMAATDGSGVATFQVTQDPFNYMLAQNGNGLDYTEFAVFDASYTVNVPRQPNAVVGSRETRASSYTVSWSSSVIQADVRYTTITVLVKDIAGQPVPDVPVAVTTFTRAGAAAFERLAMDKARGSNGNFAGLSTDAAGKATFTLKLNGIGTTFDTFDDFYASMTVVPLNLSFSTVPFLVETNKLDHYTVTAPTGTAVGVAFGSTVTASNVYNHQLSSYTESGINLVPFFTGTNVQGTGTLGTSITGAFSGGTYVVPQQTYNRIENIQIKASRQNDGKNGRSGTITISGPDHFVVAIPTGTTAGQVFVATITAVDAGGNQVVGYSATLALSAVVWNSTGTPGSGALSATNVNLPANGVVAISESYNTGQGIRLRAFDSGSSIVGYSSSMTVTQPPMTIDHYGFQFPAGVSVGVPFRFEIDALDASSAPVTYSLDRSINVQPFIAGTGFSVGGSGSLGNSNVTLVAGSSYAVVAAQTYNRIETLQLKGTDQNGIVGASTFTLSVNGPDHFDTVMATATRAGQDFQLTVIARDASNNQVLGYNGTVSLAAVQAGNTSLSGGGVLGVTSLNLAGGQVTTAFQSYTKAEGIRLRISDSGIAVTSYSSSMTVTAGPPSSLTILANPQSTVAGVASVLSSTVLDLFNNPVAGSTVTFQLLTGSGTVALGIAGLPSAVTSTDAVTSAAGVAQAFFASTNTTSAQADVLRAQVGTLLADTTVYNAVLIGPAGGTIVNFGDPNTKAIVPPNAYGTSVRLSLNEGSELAAADVAIATAAMAKSPNTFISTFTAKIAAVLDSNPNASAGNASQPVTVQFPFAADASSNVTVGAYRPGSVTPSSLLVPFSVMRVFKLNQATSVFEMVLDGTNLPNIASRSVSAQVTDPNGIYALGAPPFTPVSAGSSATVTTQLASGATATVTVPFGSFDTPVVLQLGVPSAASVPAIPGAGGATGTGITVSVSAGGVQPVGNVGVTIGYTAGGIGSANPDNLRMARYDPDTGWIVLDSQVDTIARTVTGQTNHFSLFQIVSVAAAANVSGGYAFPNPYRPSQGHTTIGFANLPASAHVKIFSVSGRLLKELDADTTGRVTGWSADDSSGKPLSSGVYIAVFINGRDRKTFKFAVQR